MIGCHGKARSTEITIDEAEMHDVRWFDRDEVRAGLANTHETFKLPGPIAIAHHLIKAWAQDEVW
jgi:NAD+ diphosphatase